MSNKLNVAIMAGGNSSEEGISLKTAAQISKWLCKDKYNVFTVLVKGTQWTLMHPEKGNSPVSWDTFSAKVDGEELNLQYAVIAIHGTPGENGLLQSYFEMKGIPYNTCGVMSSAVTFDKELSKRLVGDLNIKLAKGISITKGQSIDSKAIVDKLGLPLFVKPNESGSSYGISKVKTIEEFDTAIANAYEEDSTVVVEEYIQGLELTCGLMKVNGKTLVFPVTEIVPKNDFFDYGAKYLNQVEEITPARIEPKVTEYIQSISSEIYDRFRCRGIVRIDYILSKGKLYFLEVNTVPGMSEASIVPQQVAAMGMTMGEVFDMVIEGMN